MKWAYLFLAIAATIFAILAGIHEELPRRVEGIRICITAALVNFVIFLAMHYAKKYADKKNASNARLEPPKE